MSVCSLLATSDSRNRARIKSIVAIRVARVNKVAPFFEYDVFDDTISSLKGEGAMILARTMISMARKFPRNEVRVEEERSTDVEVRVSRTH